MAGFLSGYANAPNVLTGGLTDKPDWTPAQLDPYTSALIDQENSQANKSVGQIQQDQLYGTSPTMPSATTGAISQQQSGLGGGIDSSTESALDARANRIYSSQYNQLQNQAAANAPLIKAHLMGQAAGALQKQQDINNQLNQMQMQVTEHKNQMRNQIIGQLFSGAGSFAGTYAGAQGSGGGSNLVENSNGQGIDNNGYQGYGSPSQQSQMNTPMNNFGNTNNNYAQPQGGINPGYGGYGGTTQNGLG